MRLIRSVAFSLFILISITSQATTWTKLNKNPNSTLLMDKTSITQQGKYQKAWLKIALSTLHQNMESVEEKSYNITKSLVYFDCNEQKTATTQVFQYLNQTLIYSAGLDIKNTTFIEPVPESDIEIAMRYVCKIAEQKERAIEAKKLAETKALAKQKAAAESSSQPAEKKAPQPSAEVKSTQEKPVEIKENTNKEIDTNVKKDGDSKEKKSAEKSDNPAPNKKSNDTKSTASWDYSEKLGPNAWGKINATFSGCNSGLNQSPINIKETVHAALKKIRSIQKFSAKNIVHNNHAIQVNFNSGNMMVLDKTPFQLKYATLHTPSEHMINDKAFPLEIQLYHEDSKGDIAVMAILFTEGDENVGLQKLIPDLPKVDASGKNLKLRLKPSELIPQKQQYYRYNGSLTTPPCKEAVRWVVFKTPNHASKTQIKTLADAIEKPNNRPTQALNGRVVLE